VAGEEGSGKEQVARAIHARSPRRHGPFVAVDCGAVPAEFLEAELFGHERGAFAGADRQRPGQAELAAGGTLYLDDVGALPLGAQSRLLRLVDERRVERVGGDEEIPTDVRVVAATAVELRELVAGQLFRADLLERLSAAVLVIPPLRERPDDIVFLLKRLLDAATRELGKKVQGPTPETLDLLLAHPWPGNLRELRHVVRRAVLLAGRRIEPSHLALTPPAAAPAAEPATEPVADPGEPGLPLAERRRRAVARVEAHAIADALRRVGGDKRQAAKTLGISTRTLNAKAKQYKLQATGETGP